MGFFMFGLLGLGFLVPTGLRVLHLLAIYYFAIFLAISFVLLYCLVS